GRGDDERGGTGVETMNELVVWPCTRNLSSTSSKALIALTWTRIRKQSSPEIRWHSTTSGVRQASSAIRNVCWHGRRRGHRGAVGFGVRGDPTSRRRDLRRR